MKKVLNLPNNSSKWSVELLPRLEELINLYIGWDGYSAYPLSEESAYFCIEILDILYNENIETPQLILNDKQSIDIEWHNYGYDLEINLFDIDVYAYRKNIHTNQQDELSCDCDCECSFDVEYLENFWITLNSWFEEILAEIEKRDEF